jgi:hypothetical protein
MKVLSFCRNEHGMVLVTGLAFMAILGIMGATAMMITSTEIRISHNYKPGKQALYIAEAGVQRAIKDLEASSSSFDDVLLGADGAADSPDDGVLVSIGSSVALGKGAYAVQILDNDDGDDDWFTDLDDKVIIASTGSIHGAVRTVEVIFSKTSVPIDVDGALSIYGDTPKAYFNGNPTVNGNDHRIPEDFNCEGVGCEERDSEGGDATAGIYTTGELTRVQSGNSTTVAGNPDQLQGSEEDENHYSASYWQDFATALIPMAGVTLAGGNISDDLGTRDDPQITVISGDVHFTGTVDGAGILIVTENAAFAGNFHYEGLVIVLNNQGDEEQVEFELAAQGTARFFGAVVVAGPEPSEVKIGGTSGIFYSSEALANIQNSFNTAKVLSWRLR